MVADEHVAVVSGVGARFPEAAGMVEFAEKLFAKAKLCRPDPDRWNAAVGDKPLFTGRIPDWNRFDRSFFGIPSNLSKNWDPLMGQILERTIEAIVDAGVNPASLKGGNVSVVSASSTSDAESLRLTGLLGYEYHGLGMVGFARTMMANRLSYFLNLKGPSHSMDSSWASAVQALEIASRQIERGEVEAAIVVTSNLITFNAIDAAYDSLNWLSADGGCRPFDAGSEGFARSEATVCLFLQRASEARRLYCSLIKSRATFLGDRPGSLLHLGNELGEFLKEFYQSTGVDPCQVGYLEATGLSIREKDCQELNAIAVAFKGQRTTPLLVGALGGNMGLSEAPSAFVSLAKAIIAMETGVIPPTVNCKHPISNQAGLQDQIKMVTEATPLTSNLLAINGKSISGTAAHILIERNCRPKIVGSIPDDLPRLVILQARHEQGAREVIDKIRSMTPDYEYISMVNDVFKNKISPAYLWRCFTIVPTDETDNSSNLKALDSESRPVWWVFSGMGSQWLGMGRDLMALPPFAAAVERCRHALAPVGIDLKLVLETDDDPTVFEDIVNCFVGIATVQVGLVDVLRSVGVSFDGVVGHSVGELGCAYADGCLTAEQTVLAAYNRGRASVETKLVPGMMAAVGLSQAQIRDQLPESIDVACHNASNSCTLSGPTDDVNRFVKQLQIQNVFAKAVSTGGIAYHSRYIKDIAPKLREYLMEVIPSPKPRSSRWVSSSAPESRWGTDEARLCSAEYQTNNLLSPVLFEEASKHIPNKAIVIEIAPRGLLQAILHKSLGDDCVNLSLASRQSQSNIHHLLETLGKLHLNGVTVDINFLYPPIEYPVSRGTPGLADLVTWNHEEICYQDYLSSILMHIKKGSIENYINISKRSPDFFLWKDNCLNGQVMVPASYLLICTINKLFKMLQIEGSSLTLENVAIRDNILVDNLDKQAVISCLPNACSFDILLQLDDEETATNAITGKFSKYALSIGKRYISREQLNEEVEEVDVQGLYQELAYFGLELGPEYQLIKTLLVGVSGFTATVEWNGHLESFLHSLLNIMVFLKTSAEQELHLPSFIFRLNVDNEYFNSIETGSIVEVNYNRATNTLTCLGIELCGLTLSPLQCAPLALKWTEMKLQPYFDYNLTLKELVNASVRLASETGLKCWTYERTAPVIVINTGEDSDSLLTKLLTDTLERDCYIGRIAPVLEMGSVNEACGALPAGTAGVLLAADAALLPAAMEAVPRDCQLYCLTRLKMNGNAAHHPLYKPVLGSRGKKESYVLVKRVPTSSNIKLFEIQSSRWLQSLREIGESSTEDSIVVVAKHQKPNLILPQLASESYSSKLRVVFLDKFVPGTSLESSGLSAQLKLDLPVSIQKDQIWGFMNPTGVTVNRQSNALDYFKSSEKNLTVDCVSFNTTYFSLQIESYTKPEYLDYAGSIGGRKIMGFGKIDSNHNQVTPDPILQWTIPQGWSMEDAATVPALYSLAYYCISVRNRLENGDRVLVNAAMSALGQAVIAVALQEGAYVLASVDSMEEAEKLKEIFPALTASQVFERKINNDMNVAVRKISKGGVDLVVNFLSGEDMQSSLRALAFRGTFIHLGKISADSHESLGMITFLRNTSFYGVSFHNIFNCSELQKRKLQEFLVIGIQHGVIKPMKKTTFSQRLQDEAWMYFIKTHSTEKTVLVSNDKTTGFVKSPQSSSVPISIIAGPDMESLLSIAEKLSASKELKFFILIGNDEKNGHCNRQLNRLISKHGCTVSLSTFNLLSDLKEVDQFLKEVCIAGTVESIICVALDQTRLQNLHSASEHLSSTQFVSLLCEVEGDDGCRGLSVVAVAGSRLRVRDLLPYLPALLADHAQHRRLVVDHQTSNNENRNLHCQLPLPNTLHQLANLDRLATGSPLFIEVPTLSPGYKNILHDLLPVFLVPAVSPDGLWPLTRRLIHPAFCCSPIASTQPLEEFTEDLVKNIVRLQIKGPYTIVGESWSCTLTVHIGVLLEALGHSVEMILLQGLPSTVRMKINSLGQTAVQIKTSLISNCLDTQSKIQRDSLPVTMAASRLADRLSAATAQSPPTQLFQGHVTIVASTQPPTDDLDHLASYCKQFPSIALTGTEGHDQLISSAKTASVIHENAAFSWDL